MNANELLKVLCLVVFGCPIDLKGFAENFEVCSCDFGSLEGQALVDQHRKDGLVSKGLDCIIFIFPISQNRSNDLTYSTEHSYFCFRVNEIEELFWFKEFENYKEGPPAPVQATPVFALLNDSCVWKVVLEERDNICIKEISIGVLADMSKLIQKLNAFMLFSFNLFRFNFLSHLEAAESGKYSHNHREEVSLESLENRDVNSIICFLRDHCDHLS